MNLLKITFFTILACMFNQGKAQTLQIDNVQANLGDTASVSVNISNIDSLGSITLFISYDTTKVNFINYTNLNPHITGVIINDMRNLSNNARLGKIAISWSDLNSVNFNAEIFVIFHFKVLAGNDCPLIFLPDCELANYYGQVININYINGSITVTGLSVNENNLLDCKIYPNPFNDNISIDILHSAFIEEINIFQIDGKCVQKIIINKQSSHFIIKQLNELEKGSYFFEILSKNKEGIEIKKTYKLIKK